MSRVVHFEIHAGEPERAIEFYTAVFGWRFHRVAGPFPYWTIETGEADKPGINGGLMPRRGPIDGTAVIGYVCSVQVDSVDASEEKVIEAGGMIVVPKTAIPGVCWVVYCKDNQGNIVGIIENDPKAGVASED